MKTGPLLVLALLSTGFLFAVPVTAQTAQSRAPIGLSIDVVPQTLPADSSSHPAVVVSLLDRNGNPTLPMVKYVIYLSSSNTSVADLPATATILPGHSMAVVDVATTRAIGTTSLTAASSGLASGSATLKTVHPVSGASSLALYVSPAKTIESLGGPDLLFAVQLESPTGLPATSNTATPAVMTSSNSSMLGGPVNLTIPPGSDLGYGRIEVNSSGTMSLTVLAPGLTTGKAQVQVFSASVKVTLTASPQTITPANVSIITMTVEILGTPVPNANATLSVDYGTLVPSGNVSTGPSGQLVSKYLPQSPAPVTIRALVEGNFFAPVSTTVLVIVTAPPVAPSEGLLGLGSPYYLPIAVIAVVAVVVYLVIRRTVRKRGGAAEEEEDSEASEAT